MSRCNQILIEEGEVEPSEDELTNVLYSENKNTVSTPIPGPSRARSGQTKAPGPPTKSKSQEEKPIKKRPSPIKYPEANERVHNDEDVPLSKLTFEAHRQTRPQKKARKGASLLKAKTTERQRSTPITY